MGAQQTLNNYFSGDIAEVQVYSTALSGTTLVNVENSLECEYGLTPSAGLTAPSGLAGSAGNLEISLSWSVVPGAASYNLWRSTNNGANYELIATGLSTTSYVDTNAVNGQTNSYEVAANDGCGSGTMSSAVGVLLPLPALVESFSGNSMSIQWPVWANNWQLYYATNLTPPVAWSPVTTGIYTNGSQMSVTISATNTACFFRLSPP